MAQQMPAAKPSACGRGNPVALTSVVDGGPVFFPDNPVLVGYHVVLQQGSTQTPRTSHRLATLHEQTSIVGLAAVRRMPP